MSWMDLLQTGNETITVPWVGGRSIHAFQRRWTIDGRLPRDHGWYKFRTNARKATLLERVQPDAEAYAVLESPVKGYLVGDCLVPDGSFGINIHDALLFEMERVHLLDEGLDRFVRIRAGRASAGGPLVYIGFDFGLGPEPEVLDAYLQRKPNVDHIKGVAPALQLAFHMECRHREMAERRRAELERLRREEEERRQREERRQAIAKQLGDGAGRRDMAVWDFDTAARAALAVGNAELLDCRVSNRARQEHTVRYRMDGRRFECVVDKDLRIVDSGICLTAHWDDPNFDGGVKGDTWFTLESLPSVIREAIRDRKLVVYRHVDEDRDWEDE